MSSVNKKNSNGHNNLKKKSNHGWLLTLFFVTIIVSSMMSSVSSVLIKNINVFFAMILLIAIIVLGVIFDTIGIAVAVADETPFHAMASSKVKGARIAIRMIKNASKIATFCNDVIGDVCGVISGSASAFIAIKIATIFTYFNIEIVGIVVGALAAGLTVFGKGFGKTLAIANSTKIVYRVALLQYYIINIFDIKKKYEK